MDERCSSLYIWMLCLKVNSKVLFHFCSCLEWFVGFCCKIWSQTWMQMERQKEREKEHDSLFSRSVFRSKITRTISNSFFLFVAIFSTMASKGKPGSYSICMCRCVRLMCCRSMMKSIEATVMSTNGASFRIDVNWKHRAIHSLSLCVWIISCLQLLLWTKMRL